LPQLLYTIARIFYNVFLHPLRSYPGPLLGRATAIYSHKHNLSGDFHLFLHKLHLKYGPVVRYAPTEISYIEADVYKDVYGHRASSFQKSFIFYGPDSFGSPPGIIRAENVAHARQRKLVSHAFSDKALREQESLLKGYVDLLIGKLKERGSKGEKVDMVKWYNFTTFDIMADLTFGEPLQLLQESKYTPWVATIFGHINYISIVTVIRQWGLERLVAMCLPLKSAEKRKIHMKYSSDRVDKRLARKTDRPDIWTYITRHSEDEEHKSKGLLPTEMYSNGALFMLAGTETTATLLSGLTYYLLKNPEKMARLVKEVHTAFTSLDDMHINELSKLPYLHACIEEGLRVYPPVPGILPRIVPQGGANISGRWVSGGVC
jgi:cytochrome P450